MADGRFSQATRDALREYASQYCSAPTCDTLTIAPSDDMASGTSNIGEAAHIKGRTEGSARYDESQDDDERRSIENGIWLCRSHAALIDRNESIFTVEVLQDWKEAHHNRLRRQQLTGRDLRSLIPQATALEAPKAQEDVIVMLEEFLVSSGVDQRSDDIRTRGAWNRMATPVIATLSELTWNSIQHGHATHLVLMSTDHSIEVRANEPTPYTLQFLSESPQGRGGNFAISEWRKDYDSAFPLTESRRDGHTCWRIRDLGLGDVGLEMCEVRGGDVVNTVAWTAEECPSLTIFLRNEAANYSLAVGFSFGLRRFEDRDLRIISTNPHHLAYLQRALQKFGKWDETHAISLQQTCLRVTPLGKVKGF